VATKRITREDVRSTDSIESSYERAQAFAERHWRTGLVAVLILLTVVVAGMFISRSRADAEARAHVYWLRAQQDVTSGEYASALEYAGTLVRDHGGTVSGKRASLIRADALAGLGRQEEALSAYEEATSALADDPVLHAAALRGQATMLENLGRHAEAAAIFEPLAETSEPPGLRLFDLKAAARNRAAAGDTAAAIALYQTLVERYEDSTDRTDVQEVHLAKVAIAELRYAAGDGTGEVAASSPAS
jgi:tetratricopeptide (TPR) repeat protein